MYYPHLVSFSLIYFCARVILAFRSVYDHFLIISDSSTWTVTIFSMCYSILTRLGFYNSLRLVSRNISHSVIGLRGAARFCALRFKNCWFHGFLPLRSEGTPRDNSVKNNLLIEYWLLRISLLCLVELFVFMVMKKKFLVILFKTLA